MKKWIMAWSVIGILSSGGSQMTFGQTADWLIYEARVFQMVEATVRTIGRSDIRNNELQALRDEAAEQSRLFGTYASQCPSPEAYDAMQYILATAREVADLTPGAVFSAPQGKQIAFLRQAAHNYRASRTTPSPQQAQQPSQAKPVVYAAEQTIPDQIPLKIMYAYRSGGQGEVRPLQNGTVMHSGDHYKIVFQAGEPCHVYVFQADSSGKIYGLFPLVQFRGVTVNLKNPVKPNAPYYIPAEKKSFVLDEQRGEERFYFLAFRKPNKELEQLYQNILRLQNGNAAKSPKAKVQQAQAEFLTLVEAKGPSVIVRDEAERESAAWKEDDGQTFNILWNYLESSCDGCVNVVTFRHE